MKIISGCQNGVDQGALRAAKTAGFETGGWMPAGYRTLDGFKPEFAHLYGVQQHTSPHYPPRTYTNVRDSEATLQLVATHKRDSPGEICTRKAIKQYKRPVLEVRVNFKDECLVSHSPLEVATWLSKFSVVNVAGNSEKTVPGIGAWTEEFLGFVFDCYKRRFTDV